MLSKYKLSTRINASGIIILIFFMLLSVWIYPEFRKKMYESSRVKTRNVVESAYGVIEYWAKETDAGNISPDKAKDIAKEIVRNMRYEGKEYFWIHNTKLRMLMHPVNGELEGRDISGLTDINGKKFIVSMNKICKRQGSGFVDYYWSKPGESEPMPKISYVKLFPGWGWTLGSGIYVDDVEDEITKITISLGIVLFVITVAALLFSYFISRSITLPIYRIVRKLNESASHIAAAADEVASSGQSLSENAAEQAASIEESSASLEEITAMSRKTSELTRGAEQLMNENIKKSGQSLKSLIELTQEMIRIEADSGRMSHIVKTIDEIAFQTNLLSLSVAVEAARAGEAGAGFAVVAEEVRNLAMKTTAAAKNTQELLETTVQRVIQATRAIKDVNNDFEGIIESATSMGEKTLAITESSKEQAEGIEQISLAASEIDIVTQQVAAASQESAAASEELSAQAMEMKSFVNDLLIIVGGQKHSAHVIKSKFEERHPQHVSVSKASWQAPNRDMTAPADGEIPPSQIIPLDDEDFRTF